MSVQERPLDRGTRLGREALARTGAELRQARVDRALTVDAVAAAIGISNAEVSRIERALAPRAPLVTLAGCAGVVGLDLTLRTYPGPRPIRDVAHAQLLAEFRRHLHASVRWGVEVPLPIRGDQRAWDGLVSGTGWRYGVEAETLPRDGQALARRLNLKQRDRDVDGVILLLRDSRAGRAFLRAAADELRPAFPLSGSVVLARLAVGEDPGGNGIVVLPSPVRAQARAILPT